MKTSTVTRRIFVALAIAFLLENTVLAFNNLQNRYPVAGMRLNNKFVTPWTRPHIEAFIQKEIARHNGPILLSSGNRIFEINPTQIGYKVDTSILANEVFGVGRVGNAFQKFLDQNAALLGLKNQTIKGTFSPSLLTLKILDLQDAVNIDATPISLDFAGNLQTVTAKEGKKIQLDKLTNIIVNNIDNPPQKPIPIPTYTDFPNAHNEGELDPIRKSIPDYISKPISVISAGLVFTLTPDNLRSMVTIVERPDPKNAKKTILQLRLNDKKLNQKLGEFAVRVENNTHAEFDDHDARVAIYAQFFSKNRRLIRIPTGKNLVNRQVLGAQDDKGPKVAYLTFDDGPNSIYHPLILDILKQYNVPATFFLVGQNAGRDKDIAQRTTNEGHKVGNHSLTHSFLPNLSQTTIIKELQTTKDILKPLYNNQEIKMFRPPYGGVNGFVTKASQDLGMTLFLWDVDPRDWSEPTPDELVRRVISATNNGSDILLHSNHLATVKALPKIIEELQQKGYTFKTLD